MKSDIRCLFPSLLRIAMLMVLTLGLPQVIFAQHKDNVKAEFFRELDTAFERARNETVSKLAPKLYSAALKLYKLAEKDYDNGESVKKIRKRIDAALITINKAISAAEVSRVALAELFVVRQEAVSKREYIALKPKEFAAAERKYHEAIAKAEDGDIKSAQNKSKEAKKRYRQMIANALLAGPIKIAETKLKKTQMSRNDRKQLEQALKELKKDLNEAKKQEFTISTLDAKTRTRLNQLVISHSASSEKKKKQIPRVGGGTELFSEEDLQYSRYREGQIKRHIASNGRYLQYVWLRSWDKVDEGLTTDWPGAEELPDLRPNRRDSRFPSTTGIVAPFVPVLFYEEMNRTLPAWYEEVKTMGFVSNRPGKLLIPLYEWEHNRIRETNLLGNNIDDFVDHYYSTIPQSNVARYRYHRIGIIGYLRKYAAPGFVAIYVGFDPSEKNHILSTDGTNPLGLENFQHLGYIRTSPAGSAGSLFDARLLEYRIADVATPRNSDNMYSAARTITPIYTPEGARARKASRIRDAIILSEESSNEIFLGDPVNSLPPSTGTRGGPIEHFLARLVIAGGGDNPLYEGGISLATFSLEHIHEVSPVSLDYAKLLFDFIEFSEEMSSGVLQGRGEGIGYLRRSRNSWWLYPTDQEVGDGKDGAKWGASTDELIGVILGLKYFIRATEGSDSDYNLRAKNLLGRIANYLEERKWFWADSRIQPYTVSNFLSENDLGEGSMISYGLGTLAFQYPIARVFKEILGNSHSGPGTIEDVKGMINPVGSGAWFADLFIFVFSTIAEIGTELSDLEYSSKPPFITSNPCLGPFDIPGSIDKHRDIYEAIIANSAYLTRYLCKSDCGADREKNKCIGRYATKEFFNHAMLLYSAIMVLESSEDIVNHNAKVEISKKLFKYVYEMWGTWDTRPNWDGIANDNVLFALVAKRCTQLLEDDEMVDALDLDMRDRYMGLRVTKFKEEIERVLTTMMSAEIWQPELPLGEPKWVCAGQPEWDCRPGGFPYPWQTSWGDMPRSIRPFPPPSGTRFIPSYTFPGIGSNQAWQHAVPSAFLYNAAAFHFWERLQGKSTKKIVAEAGPFYTESDGWDIDIILEKLISFARVGYRIDEPEYGQLSLYGSHFKVEAGGNDFMFMRMLLTDIGVLRPPNVINDGERYSTIPVAGESPW